MSEHAAPFLGTWSSFYVMAGSSAAALTGLMFVVITLVTGSEAARRRDGVSMFSTPTVFHFAMALLVSAVLSAPWRSLIPPAVLVGIAGLYGAVYIVRIANRARRLTLYVPDLEDWVCYSLLPFVAFGTILAGAIALAKAPEQSLYAIAAGVLLLIFVGIRNAWDVVTFLAIEGRNLPPG
jgi:hypothetical protein